MEINKLIESMKYCADSERIPDGCVRCARWGVVCVDRHCVDDLLMVAASAMESQQQRIAELEAELKDERHRHDRYVDFELDEAEELRLAKEQLRRHGCDYCKHEELSADEYPCSECSYAGGHNSKWEWKKPEVDHGN